MTCKTDVIEIVDLVRAVLDHRALDARQLTQDFWAATKILSEVVPPKGLTNLELAVAASLLELFALRRGELPPSWTKAVPGVDREVFLIPEFEAVPYQRERCLKTAPEPLRKRGLYAPDNYLSFV